MIKNLFKTNKINDINFIYKDGKNISVFNKIKQKLLPYFFIFGSGLGMGLLTYGILSSSYYIIEYLLKSITIIYIRDILAVIAYVTGIIFSFWGHMLIIEHNERPNEISLSKGITLAVAAILLLSLANFLSTCS